MYYHIMKLLKNLFLWMLVLVECNTANAKPIDLPVSFEHKDWQLVCDNTRTCRAVGYQDEYLDDSNPVALMLKRQAGANQRVRAYVMFGDLFEQTVNATCDANSDIFLSVNGQYYGKVATVAKLESDMGKAWELTTKQTHALINSLPTSSKIEFTVGCDTYVVSDKGSTAVLLKMDEVQGRAGTRGAIVKRGREAEQSVQPALPIPTVYATAIDNKKLGSRRDTALFSELGKQMDKLAIASMNTNEYIAADYTTNDMCDALTEKDPDFYQDLKGWHFYRLNEHQLLATHQCWQAAYNYGIGYWLVDDTAPYHTKLITTDASDYENGTIYAVQKGRGIGDCLWQARWQWVDAAKGSIFIKTAEYTTGQCRGIAGGGSFILPTLVTVVVE